MAVLSEWIGTDSPLLLLPEKSLLDWEGSDPPSGGHVVLTEGRYSQNVGGPATDYDRACDCHAYLALLPVSHGEGLVLGDEPLGTAWWPEEAGGMLVRWNYGEETLQDQIEDILQNIPSDFGERLNFLLQVPDGPLHLFDAAYPGKDISRVPQDGKMTIYLPEGIYQLTSGFHEPDEHTSLLLHRLTRQSP